MKRILIGVGIIWGVIAILYLIGWWSTRQRLRRAQARYGNLLPIIKAMTDRTETVRRLPGYKKWDSQITKDQVRQVFETDLTIQSVELPDGQLWTRDDLP